MGPVWFRLLIMTSLPWKVQIDAHIPKKIWTKRSQYVSLVLKQCRFSSIWSKKDGHWECRGCCAVAQRCQLYLWEMGKPQASPCHRSAGRHQASALFGLSWEAVGVKTHTLELGWGSPAPQLLPAPLCDPKAVGSSQWELITWPVSLSA